jgi:hypothetical protein
VFYFPQISQDESYRFADTRAMGGIPNALNVVSNVFFLGLGALGMTFVKRRAQGHPEPFIDTNERRPYSVFFFGVAMTAFGSSYCYSDPNDGTLTWDQLPMAIGFMALVSAVMDERISLTAGRGLLSPFVTFGIASVWCWELTELEGRAIGGHRF